MKKELKQNTSYIVETILPDRAILEIDKRKKICEIEGWEYSEPKNLYQVNIHKITEKAYLRSEGIEGSDLRWVDKEWFNSKYTIFEEIGEIEPFKHFNL